MKKKAIKTFLLTLLITLMFSMTAFAEETQQTMYATISVNVRAGDSASTPKLGSLTKGQTIIVTGEKTASGWYPVDYNGQTGYISSKYLTATAAAQPAEDVATNNEVPTPTASALPTQTANGTTKTFSNGEVFVINGQTPNGLTIWSMQSDDGTWPDYIIAAYDACGMTNDMGDYDKAVAINNYLCQILEYDHDALIWEDGEVRSYDEITYGDRRCITTGKATCAGYAEAFDVLCTISGVYSEVVHGKVPGGGHDWNYVLIGDTKYYVDVCWNDSSNNAYLMSTTPFSDHTIGY